MAPEEEVQGEPDIKRDHRFKFPDLLGRQLDTERRHIGQQMVNLPLSNKRKDIRRFVQEICQTLQHR